VRVCQTFAIHGQCGLGYKSVVGKSRACKLNREYFSPTNVAQLFREIEGFGQIVFIASCASWNKFLGRHQNFRPLAKAFLVLRASAKACGYEPCGDS
jgi:hypothetical protein